MGIKRLAGLENTKGQMQQFVHDRDDDAALTVPTLVETLGKGFEDRVIAFGGQGRHIQGGAQGGIALLRLFQIKTETKTM